MDDYMSKPIRLEELVRVLSQCQEGLKVSQLNVESSLDNLQLTNLQAKTLIPSPTVLDTQVFQQLQETVNQDEVLIEVIDRYLEETPQLLQTIAEALSLGKAADLQRSAHTLKSTSALLGAMLLSQLCKELEACGRASLLDASAGLVFQVKTEYEKVRTALLEKRQHLISISEKVDT